MILIVLPCLILCVCCVLLVACCCFCCCCKKDHHRYTALPTDEVHISPNKFTSNLHVVCSQCEGSGKMSCPPCKGTGQIIETCKLDHCIFFCIFIFISRKTFAAQGMKCHGTGKMNGLCDKCNGSGRQNWNCMNCSGKKKVQCYVCRGNGQL